MTLTLVSVILMAGSLSMVQHRAGAGERSACGSRSCSRWRSCIFFIGGLAETNRAPFDLPEAEQELTGGFHTEYSGMRFALFFLAEYANMIVVSSVATTLFLGGWLRPFPNVAALSFLDIVPSWTWFLVKSFVFLYVFIWVRATLPRYRYDQLMRLGWKVLIPLAIANLVVTGDREGAAARRWAKRSRSTRSRRSSWGSPCWWSRRRTPCTACCSSCSTSCSWRRSTCCSARSSSRSSRCWSTPAASSCCTCSSSCW